MAAGRTAYQRLFAAYALALNATGLAVVGLAFLAFDLTEDGAAQVLATALTIKGFAYVVFAPLAAALTAGLPKRPLLLGLDALRALAILALPFATRAEHLYAAVFVFTAASAVFTPTYQALVPRLLPDAGDYARALAKSRVANELEGALSPGLAALILLVLDPRGLFVVAMAMLLVSMALLLAVRFPDPLAAPGKTRLQALTAGPRHLIARPEFRGLVPLHLAVAMATAMVLVNTVVLVQGRFGLDDRATAVALAVFGVGSVAGALAVPRLVARFGERPTILWGCAGLTAGLGLGMAAGSYPTLLGVWALLGIATAVAITPAPIVLRRHAAPGEQAVLYGALFGLANLCLILAYPVAGWVEADTRPGLAFATLGALAAAASLATAVAWPRGPRAQAAGAPRP